MKSMFRKLFTQVFTTYFPNYSLANGLDDSRENPDDRYSVAIINRVLAIFNGYANETLFFIWFST